MLYAYIYQTANWLSYQLIAAGQYLNTDDDILCHETINKLITYYLTYLL